jgi:hypothetical protein
MNAHALTFARLVAALTLTSCVNNAPADDPLAAGEPTLTLTPALPCTDPILPQFALNSDAVPTTASFEISLTGIPASQSAGLTVELSYEAPRPPACFVSALEQGEEGPSNYRCMDIKSGPLTLSARRAYDSIYCIATGPLAVTASVTLADGTQVKSEPFEMLCQSPERFEGACTPVGQLTDMALTTDMAPPDMEAPDQEVIQRPSEWSVVYEPAETAPLQLAVQGSTSGEPTSGTYAFKVLNQRGEPVAGAQTRFFLNWSPASDYPECGLPCAQLGEVECGAREACVWDPMALEGAGRCDRDPEWRGVDDRCDSLRARCEANLCLPTSNAGGVSLITPLPVSISPLLATSDEEGYARVSLVAQEEPGVFSVRAEVTIDDRTLQAITPSITVTHRIPTQRNLTLSCSPSIAPAFSRRIQPDERLGTDALGYLTYQTPLSTCTPALSDRYNGVVQSAAVFFMSEAGNITQTAAEAGAEALSAQLRAGRPSPMDLAPCTPMSGCGAIEPAFSITLPGVNDFNPRDALNRVVAITVGEAEFIDLDPDQVAGVSDVGVYNPTTDFVPPHSEPFVDANDNGLRDPAEAYFDANRNGAWDADVFGRVDAEDYATELAALACVEAALKGGALIDEVRCGDAIDARSFIEQNPVSLRAHIWVSDVVLQVGLMKEPELQLTCSGACATSAAAFNSTCDQVPSGLNLYLDAWQPSHAALSLTLSDDNLNCIGLSEVTIEASLEGDLAPFPVAPGANTLPLPYGTYTPTRDACFDQEAPLQPRARAYVTGFTPSTQPQEGDPPTFTVSYFNLKVATPDLSEGEGARETLVRLSVGVCH